MNSSLLHQLWMLIEATQSNFLLKLDDQSLIQWLVQQLREKQSLSHEEENAARMYIRSRLLLIREVF